MLSELFRWWVGQMRELAAPLLRRVSNPVRDALLLECDPTASGPWRLVRHRRGVRTEIATLLPDATDAWRRAFASRGRGEPALIALGRPFLIRRAAVPAAATGNLNSLLRYELDRLTPFSPDEVLFSHRVLPGDAANGAISVEIALALNAWVRAPLEQLAAIGVSPSALEARPNAQMVRAV